MKSLASILSSLFVGLLLGASNFAPILELQRILAHRRRVMTAVAIAAAAFVFLMAAIILASIHFATQIEGLGYSYWDSYFGVATGFLIAAALCGVIARTLMPKPSDSIAPGITENIVEVLQTIMAQVTREKSEDASPAPPVVREEPKVSTPSPEPRPTFEPQPGYAH
jgi:hypothetical protein